MKLNFSIIFSILASIACSATAETILILDAGHDPKFKGAISSCGRPEFELNDEIVQNILNQTDIKISLTRSKNEPPTLVDKNNYTSTESLKSRGKI